MRSMNVLVQRGNNWDNGWVVSEHVCNPADNRVRARNVALLRMPSPIRYALLHVKSKKIAAHLRVVHLLARVIKASGD